MDEICTISLYERCRCGKFLIDRDVDIALSSGNRQHEQPRHACIAFFISVKFLIFIKILFIFKLKILLLFEYDYLKMDIVRSTF